MKERIYSFDFLKFFAALSPVVLHTEPFIKCNNLEIGDIKMSFILISIMKLVPIFFVISGYLVCKGMQINRQGSKYIIHYLKRILKLYFGWSIIFIIFFYSYTLFNSTDLIEDSKLFFKPFYKLGNLLYLSYDTEIYFLFHFWFLVALFWSLVIIYLFELLKKVKFLFFLSLFLHLIGLFGQSYKVFFNIGVFTTDSIFFGLFYTTLGYYIAMVKINYSKPVLYFGLFIFFTCCQVIERYILIYNFNAPDGSYFLSTIFRIFFFFLFALSLPQLGKNTLLNKMGSKSVGVFLMHVLIIRIIQKTILFFEWTDLITNILWNILYPIIVYFLAYWLYILYLSLKKSCLLNRLTFLP